MPSADHTIKSRLLRPALMLFFMAGLVSITTLTSGCSQGGCGVQGDPKALIGGSFEGIDHTGSPFTDAALKGRYQLVFFGFTSCPDVCPTELANISTALDLIGGDASFFQPVFISIDPERDTPEVMTDYLSNFHESFIGITGNPQQIKDIAHVYRAYYARSQQGEAESDYTMDHSSLVYVMDCDGRYISHFSHNTNPEQMARTLEKMI